MHILLAREDDIADSILRDLNDVSEKVLVVCNHECDNNVIKEESKDKHGSYILFHQNGDVIQDIRGQLIRLQSNSAWNPRAYFVVIALGPGGLPSQKRGIPETQIVQVFAEFWKYNVIDVIVLLQSTKLHSRETPTIEAYSWFPYSESGRCAQVIACVLLDVWITNKDGVGNFLHNVSLFPPKIPKFLSGCPLRVSIFESEPFVMYSSYSEDDNAVIYKGGLDIELLQMIQKATNMSTIFRQPPSDGTWSILLDNGSWTGVLREVIEGVSDIALGGSYYRCHITGNIIECTTPYIYDEIIWYVPCAQPNPRWASLSRVFKLSLWVGFIVGYITVSVIMWAVVRIYNMFTTAENKCSTYTNVTKCFLNLWAVILGVSATENIPQKAVIRIVFLLWVVYSLAVSTVYQTFLTSYIVDPGFQHQISTIDELLDSRLECGMFRSFDTLMPDLRPKRYDCRQMCDHTEDCARRVALKRDYAFVFSKINADYMIAVHYVDSNGHPLVCHLDEKLSRQYITISVQRGSPMLKRYNDVIQSVIQGGLLDKWWREITFQAILLAARNFTIPVGDYIPLSMEHLQSAFDLLIFGCVIALVSFLTEIFFHKRN
jgi:hypothetical protein